MPAALVGLGIVGNSPASIGFGVGLCVGTLSYHWQTQNRYTEAWQFYLKVLDWEKVEQIAAGKQ
jgi:hypothetical protein